MDSIIDDGDGMVEPYDRYQANLRKHMSER